MTTPGGQAGWGRGLPQVLREHNENIKELIDHVQGEQLRGPWGPRLARRPAARLHSFVSQVGHPQGVQQGDYVGEQLSLQKPKTEYRMLALSRPLLPLASAGGVAGTTEGAVTVVAVSSGGLAGLSPPLTIPSAYPPPLQPPQMGTEAK